MNEIFSQILSCDFIDEYQDVKKSKCNYGLKWNYKKWALDEEMVQFKNVKLPLCMKVNVGSILRWRSMLICY
jgi:hypothetical protein